MKMKSPLSPSDIEVLLHCHADEMRSCANIQDAAKSIHMFTAAGMVEDRLIDEAPGHVASLVEIIEDLDNRLTEARRDLKTVTEERDDLRVQIDDLKALTGQ
jgi:hypothetical protein